MDLIVKLNDFIKSIGIDYAICGGHAIDLFLGHKTRPHKDLDVVAFWEDRDIIIQYMLSDGWDIYEPCGMEYLHKINNIHDQKRVKSNIWCVKPSNPHYTVTEHEKDMFAVEFDNSEQAELDYIEFLFNTRNHENFLYARNNEIKMRLETAILKMGDIPYISPELVLLYKSTAADEAEYQLDFDNALQKMNVEKIAVLENALHIMFPDGHKWIEAIKNKNAINRVERLRIFIDEILLNMTDVDDRRCAYLHLYGVSQACALIALRRGENVELATMAGMLHDLHTYKHGNHYDHAVKGAVLARVVLGELKLAKPTEIDMICSAIHNHSSKDSTFSAFDEVLIDADVMQHVLYNYSEPIIEHEKERFAKLVKEFSLSD